MVGLNLKLRKISLVLYMAATFIIVIPILIVLITDDGFNSYYSDLFINFALTFVIAGNIFTVVRKVKENGVFPWADIGWITGLLTVLIWHLARIS